MIEPFLDPYEVKARLLPALLLAIPILVDVTYAAPRLTQWPVFAAGGACGLAVSYSLGLLVSARGRTIEPALWETWGGPPSTRFMRRADTFFGTEVKEAIRAAVKNTFPLTLLNAEEERRSPARADEAIADAFRQVREYLRIHDPKGLWSRQNSEYGYFRNLYGCRIVWLGASLTALVFAGAYGAATHTGFFNPAFIVDLLCVLAAIYFGWLVVPKLAKRNADAYADTAWHTFLQLSREELKAR